MRKLTVVAVTGCLMSVSVVAMAAGWTSTTAAAPAGGQAASLGAPTAGTATSASSTSVTVDWTAPTGIAPTGYSVYRSTTSGTQGSLLAGSTGCGNGATSSSTATACTDSGLTTGQTYYYTVAALLSSSWTTLGTQFSGAPAAPLTATALTVTNGGATVGKPEANDVITVTFSQAIDTTSVCSTWTTGSLTGLTVSIAKKGPGSTNNVTVTGCSGALHFGPLTTTATAYNTGSAAAGFAGSMTWSAATNKLTLTLGTWDGKGSPAKSTSSNQYTFTPDSNIAAAADSQLHVTGTVSTANTTLW
jgi:hypothetical protein